MAENKVRFNLKNVHYAVLDETQSPPEWATPVAVPGAVTLTLTAAGETSEFFADGVVYYQTTANNGYEGDLEVAKIPEQMLQDVWGMTLASNNVLYENANVEQKPFALLYQIDGDQTESLFTLYRCFGTRPNIGSTTNTATKEPQTQSTTISARPLIAPNVANLNGLVHARTLAATDAEVKSAWFAAVNVPPTTEKPAAEEPTT